MSSDCRINLICTGGSGATRVFNPLMMLPLIVTPMLLCTMSYFLMELNIIGHPVLQIPWIMPPFLNAYFATVGNIPAAIGSGVMIILSTFIYYPFFRLLEKKQPAAEIAEIPAARRRSVHKFLKGSSLS